MKKGLPMLWRGFQKPKRLAVDQETLTNIYGKFSAQPFERGFGTTIGNALRRTLLSSIEGAAVTAVRIEGVLHEFQSITGVVAERRGAEGSVSACGCCGRDYFGTD
jgi:DNA-directed RNA polymerase subunit alpha